MVADGYHSLLDGANNLLGLLMVAFAYAPLDRGHLDVVVHLEPA
jgi:divalent metal cation (Fe/Co/Zn/Cd) transporter